MKKLILIYDRVLSDADIQDAKDLLKIKSLLPLNGEVVDALTVLISESFLRLKNADVSLYTIRNCVLLPSLFMSPLAPWMTIAPTSQQMKGILKLGSCVRDAGLTLKYLEAAQLTSSDFDRNFRGITGEDTHIRQGLAFIDAVKMVKFDVAKLKEPARVLIESAKY